MSARFLGVAGFAARADLTPGTVSAYRAQGRLPEPDVIVGDAPREVWGWSPETVDRWMRARPGRGARTDLHG